MDVLHLPSTFKNKNLYFYITISRYENLSRPDCFTVSLVLSKYFNIWFFLNVFKRLKEYQKSKSMVQVVYKLYLPSTLYVWLFMPLDIYWWDNIVIDCFINVFSKRNKCNYYECRDDYQFFFMNTYCARKCMWLFRLFLFYCHVFLFWLVFFFSMYFF